MIGIETLLHPDQLAGLRKSGLSDEIILEAGIKSVRPGDIDKTLGFPTFAKSAYEIPYGNGYSRFKMFYDEVNKINPKTGNERPKYLAKKDSGNRLYIPAKVTPILKDVSIPLYITEGEKKALKATQEGLLCIAISGLWNWKAKDRDELIPDFDMINFKGRAVCLVPDNDFQKPDSKGRPRNLRQAVLDLGYLLLERGAKVSWIELPSRT